MEIEDNQVNVDFNQFFNKLENLKKLQNQGPNPNS